MHYNYLTKKQPDSQLPQQISKSINNSNKATNQSNH